MMMRLGTRNRQAMFTWKPFSSDDWQWDLCEGWGPGRTHPPMERRRVRRRSLLSPPGWDPLLGPTLITVKAPQLCWQHFRNLILRPWLYVRGTANHVMIIMQVRDQTYLFLLDCILVVVAPGRHYPPRYIYIYTIIYIYIYKYAICWFHPHCFIVCYIPVIPNVCRLNMFKSLFSWLR